MRVLSLLVSALAAAACFNSNGTMNETLPITLVNKFAVVEYEPLVAFAPPTTSAPPSSSSSPTTSAPPSSSSSAPPSSSSSSSGGTSSTSTGGSSSSGSGSSSASSSASEAQDFPRLYKLRSSHRRL